METSVGSSGGVFLAGARLAPDSLRRGPVSGVPSPVLSRP